MTRPLLEQLIRRALLDAGRVIFRDGCRVRRLIAAAAGRCIAGVSIETTDGLAEIASDLVIDASGRGDLTLEALRALNIAAPKAERINVGLGYSTAILDMAAPSAWKSVVTLPHQLDRPRGGLLTVIEQGHWMLTVSGRGSAWPPADWEGFRRYAKGLRTETIYAALSEAKLVGKVNRYRFPSSVWRRYDLMQEFPDGLLPFADAICRFNPVYGQGMSVAAIEGVALQGLAQARGGAIALPFFQQTRDTIETAWLTAAGSDFRFPTTHGDRPAGLDEHLALNARAGSLAATDPAVHRMLVEVGAFLRPAAELREATGQRAPPTRTPDRC